MVIGIDGADPNFLKQHLKGLPTFSRLINQCGLGVLNSPYRPIKSALCWTSIFTGLSPKKHGVIDFVTRNQLLRRKDIPATFIWELLEDHGWKVVALNILSTLPPINYNCEMEEWLETSLSITEKEMKESTKQILQISLSILDKNPDFFAVIFPETDRASHLFWGSPKLLESYKRVDFALNSLLQNIENPQLMVVSDHGFTDIGRSVAEGYESGEQLEKIRKGGHSPSGMVITNLKPRPKSLTDIVPTILKQVF